VITVTSQAGKDSRGFSLLELLLVFFLLGLSSLIVLPTIEAGLRQRELRRSALGLAAMARDLRSRALQAGVPQQLILRVAESSYQVGLEREIRLPAAVKFSEIRGGETLDNNTRQFLFFPNGSSLGGEIRLTAEDTAAYWVRLEPLTGRIEVLRGDTS